MFGKILITILMFNHIEEILNKAVCKNKQLVDLSCPNDFCSNNTKFFITSNCYCDSECAFYGDCCNDIKQDINEECEFEGSCEMIELEDTQFIYIIDKCAKQNTDCTAEFDCEEDRKNPFFLSPVTSTKTTRTYKNPNCALCNGESENTLVPWKTKIKCELQGANYNLSSLNEAISKNILKYDSQQNEWYLKIHQKKIFCERTYEVDINRNRLRSCKKYIDTCSEKWKGKSTRDKCKQYTAFRYHKNDIYKNIHCASCNFIPLKNLSCSEPEYEFHALKTPVFATTLPSASSTLLRCNNPLVSSYSCMYPPLHSGECDHGFIYNPYLRCCITCDGLHHMEGYECVL